MSKEKLEEILFSRTTRTYAILDGASVPDLPSKLFEMKPPNYCLLTGDLEPDMAEVAPYLIRLYPGTPFTDFLLKECWGKHWGIFVHAIPPLKEMRKHFRSLITVYDETGNPMMFRYYDPRVLQSFLPTCEGDETKTFFGEVQLYFAESEDKENLVRFENQDGNLKQSKLNIK